ncbi:MAG: YwaF family protein [Clostridia bacterium]|nr:YwaF family protein [Clostridia bacterium]
MLFNYTASQKIVMPLALLFIILLGFILNFLLKNKSDKIKNIPLTTIAVLLVVLEIIKQVYHISRNTWSTWHIPIHFCSSFIFWLPFAQFSKGKIKDLAQGCALCAGILMTIVFYSDPTSIFGNACDNPFASFSTFHTFVFHFLAVAYWIWLAIFNLYSARLEHTYKIGCIFGIYYLVIIGSAYLFNTNYTNVLYSVNASMETFRLKIGQVPFLIILFIAAFLGIMAISMLVYLVQKLVLKIKTKYDR